MKKVIVSTPFRILLGAGMFLAASTLFTACQPENIGETALPAGVTVAEQTAPDLQLDEVARALVPMLEDQEVRVFLKTEALKKFDGDYDVLYLRVADHAFANGQTFEAKLSQHMAEVQGISSSDASSRLAQILADQPLLNFAIPVQAETWNAENELLPVTVRPDVVVEEVYSHIKAYSREAEKQLISLESDPAFPVVVVGWNERCDVEGNVFARFERTPDASRNFSQGQSVDLVQVNIPDLNRWESWVAGAPEFWANIRGTYITGNTAVGYVQKEFDLPGNRSDYSNSSSWFVLNEPLFSSWDDDDPGRKISLSFREEDGGLPVKVTLKLFEAKVKGDWMPDWLELSVGPTLSFDNIGKRNQDMGTITIDRETTCWTDFYTGTNIRKNIRFYLNCD